MNLFDKPQAGHFCRRREADSEMVQQSLRAFHERRQTRLLREGTTDFEVHRLNLLRAAEQWILYAVTNYRRSIEMLVPSSTPWAHVTLYYSSFFAANAVLAMFGGWIGLTRVVDVEDGTTGSQTLKVHAGLRSPSRARGNHRAFWDFYYDSVPSLAAWTPEKLSSALSPTTGDYAWQITPRNEVNYDMAAAWGSTVEFGRTFDRQNLSTVTGRIGLQLEATECMVRLAGHFAKELSLDNFGLVGTGESGNRRQLQRRLAAKKPPNVLRHSAFGEMLGI